MLALAVGKELQDPHHIGAGVSAGEFAVAERAGAALAEEVVALRFEVAAIVEGFDVPDAFVHRGSSFKDERLVAHLGQEVTGHETRRAATDDHRSVPQRFGSGRGHFEGGLVEGLDSRGGISSPLQDARFGIGRETHLGVIDKPQVALVTDIEAFSEDPPVVKIGQRDAQGVREQ